MKRKQLTAILGTIAILFSSCTRAEEVTDSAAANKGYSVSPVSTAAGGLVTDAGNTLVISGGEYKTEGNIYTISQGGTYTLKGSLNGQIIVDAGKNDRIELVLSGVDLLNAESAPVYIKKAGEAVIVLEENTTNTITDGNDYIFPEGEDEPTGAVFSKSDLVIKGGGKLIVNGNYKNGIAGKDSVVIENGDITVNAVNDGIRGKDQVTILAGDIKITSGNDGIKSNNDTDEEKGFIIIEGGNIKITSLCDGIQAENYLRIENGNFEIKSGPNTDGEESTKGLKAEKEITINGGNFVIESEDDGLHCDGSIEINGGTIEIITGDDGIRANEAVVINNGNINILESYEGIEASTVDINGGTIVIKSSDDGINASDPDGSSGAPEGNFGMKERNTAVNGAAMTVSFQGRGEMPEEDGRQPGIGAEGTEPGMGRGGMMPEMGGTQNPGRGGNENLYIRITGGYVEIDAGGDGIDSNGALYIDGGTVFVSSSALGNESALDSDGVTEINGGTVVAAGGSLMDFPSEGQQPFVAVYYSQTQKSGSVITVKDGNEVIASFEPMKGYKTAVISSPYFEEGKTIALYSGDSKTGDISIKGVITSVTEDGTETANRGGMNAGGRGRR